MAIATDAQVQAFADQRVRPRAEQIRALLLDMQDDKASIGDIYANLTQQSVTWKDGRTDGPPHLLQPSDILSYNTLITDLIAAITGDGQYPVIASACVRPVGV